MREKSRAAGRAKIEVRGAEPELFLDRAAERGLGLAKIRREDAWTVRAETTERELPALGELAEETRCELELVSLTGGSRDRRTFRRRAALLAALAAVAALLLCSSLFLWEIEVRGCETTEEGRVLRVLADEGVGCGSFWPGIDVDLVRSRALLRLPEIAWLTVNVSGSRAVVLVAERQPKPEIVDERAGADLVASRPGVVRRVQALSGDSRVQPGDAVLEGEVLVSGSRERFDGALLQTRAMGEVWAETWHEISAVCPLSALRRQETGRSHSRFALRVGKLRLDLPDITGKGLDECGMIVHEYRIGWKGLLALPLGLIREERFERAAGDAVADRSAEMGAALLERLETEIRGQILESHLDVACTDELLIVTLRAHCLEDIAKTVEKTP